MKIISARNPKYTKDGGIDLFVTFESLGEIPFHATEMDCEAHGRELYIRAVCGDFGTVAPYVAPVPTLEEIQKTLTDAIQNHLDTKPKERLYDGILSLCTYATSSNPKFAAEGQAGVAWRDACWAKGYEIMAEVQAGTREIPTKDELLAELPAFTWPEVTP